MTNALANDLAQRLLTLNKLEQRACLSRYLKCLPRGLEAELLDFGCGTGLFVPTVLASGFTCTGLDIDPELTGFAARRYPAAKFVNSLEALEGKCFDVILANCCFHHIPDQELDTILPAFRGLLKPTGRLLVIDILDTGDRSPLHNLFMKLEKGMHIRDSDRLKAVVGRHFTIENSGLEYGGVFSIRSPAMPFGNYRLVLQCR